MGRCRSTLFLIDIAVILSSRFVGHLWQLLTVFDSRVASVLPEIGFSSRPVYSALCYSRPMTSRGEVLHKVMSQTGTTQSDLSRISGVRQPSISQFVSGKVDLSDEQLDRLLSCMGFRLEVMRRPVEPDLNRSERRSWELHRRLSSHLTRSTFEQWRPIVERNIKRLRGRVNGQPHTRNLGRWQRLVETGDVLGIQRVLTGLDRDSIEMREVSPMGGLLPQAERTEVLAGAV